MSARRKPWPKTPSTIGEYWDDVLRYLLILLAQESPPSAEDIAGTTQLIAKTLGRAIAYVRTKKSEWKLAGLDRLDAQRLGAESRLRSLALGIATLEKKRVFADLAWIHRVATDGAASSFLPTQAI